MIDPVSLGLGAASLIGGLYEKKRARRREAAARQQNLALAAPLRENAEAGIRGRQGLTHLQQLAIDSARSGRPGERAERLGQASADVAIAAGPASTSLSGVFDRALTRARGLSRLARHTSDQFDDSLMKERLGLVKMGRQRQGTGLMGVLDSIGVTAGVNAAGAASREVGASARSNILGSAVGLGIGAIPDIRDWNQRRRAMSTSVPGVGGYPDGSTYGKG